MSNGQFSQTELSRTEKQLTRFGSFDLVNESLVGLPPLPRHDKWAGSNYGVDVRDERLTTANWSITHRNAYDRRFTTTQTGVLTSCHPVRSDCVPRSIQG